MQPSYIKTYQSGKLATIAAMANTLLEKCALCPRKCGVNRLKEEYGFCRTGSKAVVYSYMAHHGEEPPISGTNGSGTIFFSNCTMACCYCQNSHFSQKTGQGGQGKALDAGELASLMLELQEKGCHNINFVTPTHVMPQILSALEIAAGGGLKIPLVYNTSGYELPEMVYLLDCIIDVYLPDMRYSDPAMSLKYSQAPDYPRYNQAAVKEMQRQTGNTVFNDQDVIERGVIIRHLVLPENISGTGTIMKFLAEQVSPETYISLMSQYFPCHNAQDFKELNRRLTQEEFAAAQSEMDKYGLHNGWTQESGGLDRFAGTNIKPSFES
jgi:putative pyruvate formate lyase activating enzyme